MKVVINKNAPDFLIIGAAKSGTTSLWYYLNQHPEIFMNQGIKELGYFSKYYGINDFDDYIKYFNNATPQQIIGEACHAYLTSEESAKLIYDFNPRMKIVVILRNPVRRAYSLYNWMVEYGYERASKFEDALNFEETLINDSSFKVSNKFYYMNYLYYNSGLYYDQLRRYLEVFPKENIHIIIYETFKRDNLLALNSILNFLGLKSDFDFNLEKQNESIKIRNPRLQYFLSNNFDFVADKYFIPRRISNIISAKLKAYNRMNEDPMPMDKAIEKELFEKYRHDIEKLSSLIGTDLFKFWS